jgi:predicted PurR-regulated permease PerM
VDAETADMSSDRSRMLRRQAFFWGMTALVTLTLLYVFSGILLPFVFGMAIAYFLDPVADWLEKRGLSRLMASLVILLVFIVVLIGIVMVVVPVIGSQIVSFVARLPEYLDRLQQLALQARAGPLQWLFPGDEASLKQDFGKIVSEGSGLVSTVMASLWTSSLAVVNFLSIFVVTPVVAFYLLLDWDRMVQRIDDWIPRQHVTTVRRLAGEIDRAVAGFIRGQSSVCLLLGTYYAVGLSLIGLNFGLLIGLFAGLISFVPYVGSTIGLILALGVALVQFWPDWIWVVATLAVFFTGQFFEGNILQPKLVGASVGLHPVWLMFALFAFGALFGFVGLLIAVPAAAAVGVLMRFVINQYLQSEMYYGRSLGQEPLLPGTLERHPMRQALDAEFKPSVTAPDASAKT